MEKKLILTVLLLLFPIFVFSQKLNVHKKDGSFESFDISNIDSITFATYGTACADIPNVTYAGKTYNTVQIGDQCWLRENLDVGTMIQSSEEMSDNGTIEKYCYDNDPNNCNIYGGLYKWNEAMQYVATEGTQGICPSGWHIPNISELQTLVNSVGGDCNSLKEIGEGSGDGVGTNTSGFSGLLAGAVGSNFGNLNTHANFWSSTEADISKSNFLGFDNNSSDPFFSTWEKSFGFSLRCLKD